MRESERERGREGAREREGGRGREREGMREGGRVVGSSHEYHLQMHTQHTTHST